MTVTNIDFSKVTPEQIGRCSKVFGPDNKPFYMALSETDDLTEYKVQAQYNNELKKWIFTCTCPSGKEGFANVHHPSGVCKHVRWSLAAAAEEKAAMAEQVALNAAASQVKRPINLSQEEKDRFYAARPEWFDSQAEREAFAAQHPDLVEEYADCWEVYLVK